MNGFANAVLSLLLSWIRVIISQFWKLFSSDTGEKLFAFFSKYWLTLVIILCAAGIAVDLVIYFLRWRPDQVWRSRRLKKEAEWAEEEENDAPSPSATVPQQFQWEDESGFYPDDDAVQRGSYRAGYATAGFQPVRGERALDVVERQVAPYVQPAPRPEPDPQPQLPPTAVYPPIIAQTLRITVYTPIVPVQAADAAEASADFDPFFDDAPLDWADGDALLANKPSRYNEAMPASFTTPMSRPDSYYRDMQAGYAPQLTPQQMYAPNDPGPPSGPVHPGLDADSLRRNIGLSPAGSLADRQEEVYKINTNPMNSAAMPARSRNLFTTLARKARDFMGADENAERSIYDLQPPVDMNGSFHEPVYPQPRLTGKDDQTSNF